MVRRGQQTQLFVCGTLAGGLVAVQTTGFRQQVKCLMKSQKRS